MNPFKPRTGRRSFCIGIFVCLSLATVGAKAEPTWTLELGPELDSFHYREPGLIKESGLLYGGFAALTASFHSNLVWNIEASLAAGTLRYEGQTMAGEPVSLDTPNRLANLRTSLGYRWDPLMPYVGLGLRYWNDRLNANSPNGYNRQTAYLYSPLGLEISRTFGQAWRLGASAEFELFWGGLNRNTDFPPARDETIDLHQHAGYGARAAVFLKHPVTRSLGLMIEPFFQYWNIGESDQAALLTPDALYLLFEPANQTSLFGLRGGLSW